MPCSVQHGNFQALLNIDYQPPSQNFDRTKVKGRIVRLITVKDDRFSIALEQAAKNYLLSLWKTMWFAQCSLRTNAL
jgi:hypothetical protein